MKRLWLGLNLILFLIIKSEGQGLNHQWLMGSYLFLQDPKGRMFIDSNNYSITTEFRKMVFNGTEANICDSNGNFLMSSNGVWIANANNDTMMFGTGLNPNGITSSWPYGLPMVANNVFIPMQEDTDKYVLLHHSASTFNGTYYPVNDLFRTVIDLTLDGGLGGVILKNDLILNDTLNGGIAVCKHANGRDWWVVMNKDSSDIVFKILLNNNGVVSISSQHLNYSPLPWGNFAQLSFSLDGEKFCTTTYDPSNLNSSIVICDFDRCSGVFSNSNTIPIAINSYLLGLSFSPSGQYIYACSSNNVFQIDVNTLIVDTVATYDGFISPPTSACCATDFWNMYLAANGKIYITSGSGVQHLHVINNPDSGGLACDVQQHAIDLIDYRQLRAVPNHPNYYLGCDTTLGCTCLTTSLKENAENDFHFRLYPNPVINNFLHIGYQLPQNKNGLFQIYDVTGKSVFKYGLPQWSNEQSFALPLLNNGIYVSVITSGSYRVSKKFAVINSH